MSDKPYILDFKDEDETLSIKDLCSKYIRFWPWFLVSCAIFLVLGHYYSQYTPQTYYTEAKIKILDDEKEPKIIPNDRAVSNPNVRLNLENHIEVLKSYKLLSGIVEDLGLDIDYYESNRIFYSQIWSAPFNINKIIEERDIAVPLVYEIKLTSAGFNVTDGDGNFHLISYDDDRDREYVLPFTISLGDIGHINDYKGIGYRIIIRSKKQATMLLSEELKIDTSENQSDIITLSMKGNSTVRTEAILDALVQKFDNNSIADKQLVAQRTLSLIDQRFKDLSAELDSIELSKEDYKKLEDLSYIQADADASLAKKTISESEVLRLETQLSLLGILKKSLYGDKAYNLLAADIGLANQALNTMVQDYNELARERQKLMLSVGKDHPKLKNLSERLDYARENILKTVRVFEAQMKTSLRTYNQQRSLAGSEFSQLPEQERILRSMERQQNIKENLYLLLLRKREEAAIDYDATSSSVKVIDYSVSGLKPIWPKKTIIYPVSLLLGFIFPFVLIFLRSSMDTKVHDRSDIEKINPDIPTLIEIPYFKDKKTIHRFQEGSALAESFRILSTNADYLIEKKEGGKVVFVTSAVKEEGKTMTALNLSLAYASLGKRVLLVGADLRNPQLHSYMDADKNGPGLSDFLKNSWFDFQDGIQFGFKKNYNHHVYLSGAIPESAPVLLSKNRFGEFLEEARNNYDYIVVDTAPTMLVTDTLLISKYADVTLFVLRSGLTDKNLLHFSSELQKNNKLKNMAYVVNAVGNLKDRKYNYGYAYGYST